MDAGALTDGLTPGQEAAVISEAMPLCVIAGAGSGKTEVLTRRIAYRAGRGTLDPEHVLALTFTRKAAGELRRRLGELGLAGQVAAGTFHGVALAQLRRRGADQGRLPPAVLSDPSRLLRPLLAAAGYRGPRWAPAVAGEIAWARARLVAPPDYPSAAAIAGRRSSLPAAVVASVYARYQEDKRRRRVLDLDDVIATCTWALENDQEFAGQQRWRWRHLFVDEYQDLNPAHARLLSAWLGDGLDLFVVGDPHQAIYGWNGAEPSLLDRFAVRYPSAGMVTLDDNFRSSPEIVATAEAVLGTSRRQPNGQHRWPARARAGSGPIPRIASYPTDAEEAAAIARSARDLHVPGTSWSRQAVLTRTNAQLPLLANALEAAGIPTRFQGGRPLHQLAAVRAVLDPIDGRGPARSLVADVRVAARDAGAVGPDPGAQPAAELAMLLQALDEYLALDPAGTVDGFRQWLDASDRVQDDAPGDAVVLSTFHRAKGLEWSVVFVAGVEEGLVPLVDHGPALDEEARLLYVALTRARTELLCSWARRRTLGRGAVPREPSRWLTAIEAAVTRLGQERQPVDGRPHLRVIRERLEALARSG